ncbi:hypothetical protein CYMTET_36279 [Cymbomonas tetramitiformis]|uniref:Uncharacterized protein n=1 Tax=Cymbomonas tetramitiformis TaxID=36881 RepID=A0AAE0CG83_9CHLO|nr:hypothetical protein CYMTET_36279 [Cymbomonas tetramitiformis]
MSAFLVCNIALMVHCYAKPYMNVIPNRLQAIVLFGQGAVFLWMAVYSDSDEDFQAGSIAMLLMQFLILVICGYLVLPHLAKSWAIKKRLLALSNWALQQAERLSIKVGLRESALPHPCTDTNEVAREPMQTAITASRKWGSVPEAGWPGELSPMDIRPASLNSKMTDPYGEEECRSLAMDANPESTGLLNSSNEHMQTNPLIGPSETTARI